MQTCSKNVTHVIMHVGEIKVYVDMSEFVFAKKNYSCANTFGRNGH